MDAGPLDWTTTDDPIDVLLGEHRTILGVLAAAEREAMQLQTTAILRESFWHDVLRFAEEFDAGLHHQKEELLLFPAIEAAGLSPATGPAAVLRDEHRRSDHLRQRVAQALGQRDRLRLAAAAGSWLDLTRSHVLKENQILFPLARRLLGADELQRLHREFRPLAADQRVHYWLRHPFVEAAGT
jgi:hemerythrin-like domain-containing protein